MRLVATLTTLGTALVGAWLVLVLVTVVPARDPGSMGVWSVIATVTIASAVGTALALTASPSGDARRRVALATSIAAVLLGTALVWTMATATGTVEEYVLLIGGWLVVHGLASLLLVARTGRDAARSRHA